MAFWLLLLVLASVVFVSGMVLCEQRTHDRSVFFSVRGRCRWPSIDDVSPTHLLRVKGTGLAREALADDFCVLVDEYRRGRGLCRFVDVCGLWRRDRGGRISNPFTAGGGVLFVEREPPHLRAVLLLPCAGRRQAPGAGHNAVVVVCCVGQGAGRRVRDRKRTGKGDPGRGLFRRRRTLRAWRPRRRAVALVCRGAS